MCKIRNYANVGIVILSVLILGQNISRVNEVEVKLGLSRLDYLLLSLEGENWRMGLDLNEVEMKF